jgi:hypothetical protein
LLDHFGWTLKHPTLAKAALSNQHFVSFIPAVGKMLGKNKVDEQNESLIASQSPQSKK